MNTPLLSVVVNPELRIDNALHKVVVENTSAGTPWLTEQ